MKTSSIIAVPSMAISSVIAVPTGGSSGAPTCSSSQAISCRNTKMTTTNDKSLVSALNGISLLSGRTGVGLCASCSHQSPVRSTSTSQALAEKELLMLMTMTMHRQPGY
ncbi:hypothetical protein LTR16_002708, partial [Cryomyces antarcticus]